MRKRWKRTLAALLCGAMFLGSLAACGGTGSSEGQVPGGETEAAATEAAEPVAGVDFPKYGGTPDKADILYASAIENYKKTDWTAEWIWTKACSEDSYVAFRKTFTLDSDVENATAFISAVDKYVLWVNGEMIVLDGSVKRGATPVDSYYDTVEISNLKKGENVIVLLVAFNGRSGDGSIVPVVTDAEGDEYTQAGLLFEMKAGNTVIASDASWKAARHTAYKNRITGGKEYVRYEQSSMLAERNVWYDARENMGDFTAANYDDSAWENASRIAKAGDLPFGDLYDAIIAPVKFEDVVDFENAAEYVGKELTEDTTLTLNLPGNIQFTWEIELEAPAGKKLTVYTNTYTDRDNLPNFKDTYVTCDGAQRYENYPWRSGSKLIIEAEAGVKFTKLGYRKSGFNGEWAGSFTALDEALTQLWQESLNTIAICMRDTYMDCPERERGPYMGDASNQIDAALYSYDEGGLELTKKAILACLGWTKADGAIPSRAPSVKPQEIPNQSLAFMTSTYHYYLHSGDTETMTAYYKAFVNYLRLFEMDENGLLPLYRSGSWSWNDWGNKVDTSLLQLGFYTYALRLAKETAEDLGMEEDREFLEERLATIEANWRSVYAQEDGFRSADSTYVDERGNAMLVLAGLAKEEDYEQITNVIMSTYEASPFTEKYILEALCMMGKPDLAIERMEKRYAPMLTDEWDTLWEQFNDTVGTYNHGWTAAPLYILSKYVAGVRPTAPGFETYEIVPFDGLESFSCTVWSPKGLIKVSKEGSTLTIDTAAQGGTLILPSGEKVALEVGTQTVTLK
ncbi:MAG: alpha-L-rhamnosidase N-terminal domain-containing protein [Lachnospiraceae bacterium]|nr:alpha-L-rhamnosidase N-terminal domain-containing protein [Lachnospiraceae bacterium]